MREGLLLLADKILHPQRDAVVLVGLSWTGSEFPIWITHDESMGLVILARNNIFSGDFVTFNFSW